MMLVSEYSKNNTNTAVIEKWETIGYLNGVNEEDKKYLADLYESLSDSLSRNDGLFNRDEIIHKLMLGVYGCDDISCDTLVNIDEVFESTMMSMLRQVYERSNNKSFSLNDFADTMSGLSFNNSEINEAMNRVKSDSNLVLLAVEKIIDEINENNE